jgi:hypothetical protein
VPDWGRRGAHRHALQVVRRQMRVQVARRATMPAAQANLHRACRPPIVLHMYRHSTYFCIS